MPRVLYLLFLVSLTSIILSGCGDSKSEDFVANDSNPTAATNTTIQLTGVVPRVLARNAQIPSGTVFIKVTLCEADGTVVPTPTTQVGLSGSRPLELANGEGLIGPNIVNASDIVVQLNRPVGVTLVKITYLDGNNLPLGRTASRVPADGGRTSVLNPPLLSPGQLLTCEVLPNQLSLSSDPGVNTAQLRVNGIFGAPSDGSPQDITALAQFVPTESPVASVSATGLVTGLRPGQTTVNVVVNGETKPVQVTVGNPDCTVSDQLAGPRTQVTGAGFTFQHTRDCHQAFTFGTFRVNNNSSRSFTITVAHTAPLQAIEVANDTDLIFASNTMLSLAPGASAVFRARYTNSETNSFSGDLTVLCDDGSGPPQTLRVPISGQILPAFTVGQNPINHTHTFGVSDCPDPIGAFPFTNNCDQSVMVTLDPGRVFSPAAPVTVAAGATVQIPISFDCGTANSFSELVRIRVASSNGTSTTNGPSVTVNIVAP